MKKFILTAEKFTGNVVFGYNEEGFLVYFLNEGDMEPKQHEWLLANTPVMEDHIKNIAARIKGTLEEIPEDLSFEVFWRLYDRKIKRHRAEPIFEKLSEGDKMLAIRRVKPYKAYLERTKFRGQADADKYLKERYFETDWSKER